MNRRGNRQDHDTFCTVEEWTLVRGATGKLVQHHRTYELTLPDGRILRTRISRPINTDTYGAAIWAQVLSQLDVGDDAFWRCVRDRIAPRRETALPLPEDALPLRTVMELRRLLHLSDDEIAALSRADAGRQLAEYWAGEA